MVYGDYSQPEPQARIIEAVARGEVDVAIAWGPVAGFFAQRSRTPLDLVPVTPWLDGPLLPMQFDVSMGVRKGDHIRRRQLDDWLTINRPYVERLLRQFEFPSVYSTK
jgi:mxaJ protein